MTKRRLHKHPRRPWTKVEDRILRRHYPHMPTADLAHMLPGRAVAAVYQRAQRFGLHKTQAYLNSPAAHRLDGIKGMGTRFQKGQVPPNKGLRRPGWGPGRMKETQFKPGQRSKRWDVEAYSLGALRITTDGYLLIKATPDRSRHSWQLLNRFVWESEHGPIPPDRVVRAKNGDQHDTRIENLDCISRRDNLLRNYQERYPLELRRIHQLRGALQRQINKREGKREQHDQRSS